MPEYAEIQLIPFGWEHVNRTFNWIRDPLLQRDFLMRNPPTFKGNQEYFRSVLADKAQRVFALYREDSHVGNCGLKEILPDQQAELWLYVGETKARGQGVAYNACKLLIEYAFGELELRRIALHVGGDNHAALGLYSKLGFSAVSLPLDKMWRGRDVICMEISKP